MLVGDRPDRLLPRADGVHAEPLDDGAARLRVLLRLLRLRAAVSRPLPRSAPRADLRPRAGRAAPDARAGARHGGDRRRLALPLLAAAPFLLAAFVVVAACAAPVVFVREDGGHGRVFEGVGDLSPAPLEGLPPRIPDVRRFLIANTAWEGTFAGARTFVVLYITVGLGAAARVDDGRARRRRGRVHRRGCRARASSATGSGSARVIAVASVVYGLGLLLGGIAQRVAALVPAGHLRRRDRRRRGDDARVGPALQADAAAPTGARSRGSRRRRRASACSSARCSPAPRSTCSRDSLERHAAATRRSGRILGVPVLLAIPLVWRLSAAERDAGAGQPESPEPIT